MESQNEISGCKVTKKLQYIVTKMEKVMFFRDLFDEKQLESVKRGLISQPDLVDQRELFYLDVVVVVDTAVPFLLFVMVVTLPLFL